MQIYYYSDNSISASARQFELLLRCNYQSSIDYNWEHYKKVTVSNILHLKASKMHQINNNI